MIRIAAGVVAGLLLAVPHGGLARGPLDALTLEQQVGQVVLLSFSGATVPEYVRVALAERRVAGVILFAGNIAGREQLRALTRDLRRPGGRPIVAVDQEGGRVRRLLWAGPGEAQPEQLARGTVRADAERAARSLHAVGVTVTFAPVADVPSVRDAALAGRSFSRDPLVASGAVRAAVKGWRAGGVAATAKHFPGLGGAPANTDDAIVTIGRSRGALDAVDLPPFRAAIAAGVSLVMVGHARYPELDRSRIASQSRPIVEGLLREELGFRGVVVTDSLEAQASLATGSIATVSERALRAGVDLLLLTGTRLLQARVRAPAHGCEALAGASGAGARGGRRACSCSRRKVRYRRAELQHPLDGVDAHAEVAEEPVLEPVDEAVHGEILATRPRVLDDRRLADVHHLLGDVQLAQPVQASLIVGERVELGGCFSPTSVTCLSQLSMSPCRDPSSAARTPPQP